MKKITAENLSKRFSKIIRQWSGKAILIKIINLNMKEKNPLFCHSHDFFDSNEAMIQAMSALGMKEFNAADEKQSALINAAWDISKKENFSN